MDRKIVVALALLLGFAFAGPTPPVDAADAAARIAILVPGDEAHAAVGREVAYGVALAVDESDALKKAGEPRPAVETVPLSATDAASATAAVEEAAKRKCTGVIAYVGPATAVAVEAAARKAKLAIVVVGAPAPARTIEAPDPVFRAEPAPGDVAMALADALRFRSGRSSLGLPAKTTRAWLVAEDAPWAHAAAQALRGADDAGVLHAAETFVRPGTVLAGDAVGKVRGECDRVVVLAGPAVSRAVVEALDDAGWTVPVLATGAAIDGATCPGAPKSKRAFAFVLDRPLAAEARRVDGLAATREPPSGKGTSVTPLAIRSLVAAAALIDAANQPAKSAAGVRLRALTQKLAAHDVPLFDAAGSLERWTWSTWAAEAGSPIVQVKPGFLPDPSLGPLLGGKPTVRYRAAPGATCVRIGFGGAAGFPPRTVDTDLAMLGLHGGASAGAADELVLGQIVARTCGKLSRIWQRNYDGSARDAYSWRISFVPQSADTAGAAAVWDAVIAGDGPDGLHGGQAFPAQKRAQALSTYLLRRSSVLQAAKLTPPLAATDVPYLDGTYAWNTSGEGNQRSDRLRALIDGVASAYAMKLSKEIGHLAGLGVDHSGEARSVMVAAGGEGVPDEAAYFPPPFAKVLEKTLGRVPSGK